MIREYYFYYLFASLPVGELYSPQHGYPFALSATGGISCHNPLASGKVL